MMRADELVTVLGLAESRAKARALIEEKKVFCNGKPVDKPSRQLCETDSIEIDGSALALRYVSRAGLKLEAFLDKYNVDLRNMRILDAGASTGGFTDCVLSRGASMSVCVDVGSGQLHGKLLSDPRVVNMEKTDIRSISLSDFDNIPFDFICADLSFISLEKVLKPLFSLLSPDGMLVCLVKPQFETSPEIMRKSKGVLKDEKLRHIALDKITNYIRANCPDFQITGVMPSPIRGGDGNIEYLLGVKKFPPKNPAEKQPSV